MAKFTVYNQETGEILAAITCPDDQVEHNTPDGAGRIDGEWPGDQYWVQDGQPVPLRVMQPTIDGAIVNNLPVPCRAMLEGATYDIDDGSLELDASLPGPYNVQLIAIGYLPCMVTIP
jgi:hypothetical protein